MKKTTGKMIRMLLLTVAALGVGFVAIAFPFRLFDNLTAAQMRYLFLGEIALYFTVGMVFLFIKGKKDERKAKEEARSFRRRIQFEQAKREYYDLAA